MSDEPDRVAMLSDLQALEARLETRVGVLEARFDQRLSETEETMRRDFNVVAERIESAVKLVAEVNSHHATVLDDHEHRLQKIERRS